MRTLIYNYAIQCHSQNVLYFSIRRYDGVIMGLHRGTQCSSCGLRFREADNAHYRQHLDWHFRMNRKEKEITAAHRSWFITVDVCMIYFCAICKPCDFLRITHRSFVSFDI